MDSPIDVDALRERYTSLREAQRALNKKLVTMLPTQALPESARKLGLWRDGGIWVGHENDFAVLTDFAIYHYRLRGGTNAVERLRKQRVTAEGTPVHAVVEAMQSARFTALQVVELVVGAGAIVNDLMYGGEHFLADILLPENSEPRLTIGAHVLTFPDFLMTTGAPFAVEEELIGRIVAVLRDESTPEHGPIRELVSKDKSWLTALIIMHSLAPDENEDDDESEDDNDFE